MAACAMVQDKTHPEALTRVNKQTSRQHTNYPSTSIVQHLSGMI